MRSMKDSKKAEEAMKSERLSERVEEATQPEKLSERAEGATQPERLSERVEGATQPERISERVQKAMQPERLSERAEELTQPEKLSERAEELTKCNPHFREGGIRLKKKKDSIEQRLKACRVPVVPREEKILAAIQASKRALCEGEEARPMSYLEFLYQQAMYMQKRWWVFQAVILGAIWWLLYSTRQSQQLQRSTAILVPLFAVMIMPEIWKNRANDSMEIEGTAYFSLRQIYAARMLLFALVDTLLLSCFFVAAAFTLKLTLQEIMLQFFLPFNVTVCICFRTLCSRRENPEYLAVALCLVWTAVWGMMIMKENIYHAITTPFWAISLIGSLLYLVYSVRRTLETCESYWEVHPSC